MQLLSHCRSSGLIVLTLFSHVFLIANDNDRDAKPLVLVNGHAVTTADLQLKCLIRGISVEERQVIRRQLLEQLIDERLISEFLKSHRIQATMDAVDAQIDALYSLIRRRGKEPDELLENLGLTENDLREVLSLQAAWNSYVLQNLGEQQLKDEFESHRREWDGTQVRARHIVLKVPPDSSDETWIEAEHKLTQLRTEIAAGKVSFVEAARLNSEGPSAATGGDVGFFPFRGIMPPAFAASAFALRVGEISQPTRTSVGVHLIEVTDEQPGQLSLEDVRSAVLARISQEKWDTQSTRLRDEAQIQWTE